MKLSKFEGWPVHGVNKCTIYIMPTNCLYNNCCGNKYQENIVQFYGWMDVHFGPWVLTLSKDYSLASYPST